MPFLHQPVVFGTKSDSTVNISDATLKNYLGGKGASLWQMTKLGMPVPPGMILPVDACLDYMKIFNEVERGDFINHLTSAVCKELHRIEAAVGYMPLFAVRSGAPVSMPGMMDTILNVGLNSSNFGVWSKRLGDKYAHDSFQRGIKMTMGTCFSVEAQHMEAPEKYTKKPSDLTMWLLERYKIEVGDLYPLSLADHLRACIATVLESWENPRAVEYRNLNGIPHDMGTAVVIQAMVFGNTGPKSGSGVLFTRDPSTGEDLIRAEYLPNAQGEDVVAGTHTPEVLDLNYISGAWTAGDDAPKWCHDLVQICDVLEDHYRDMVDVEFTVQDGKLYILQSRVGKRTAKAAFRIAYEMMTKLAITPEEAFKKLTPATLRNALRPTIHPTFKKEPDGTGLAASSGVVTGKPVFSVQEALDCLVPCILVREETDPDDLSGMNKAVGILTRTGGITSHAAVVARAMNKPCVTGLQELSFHPGNNMVGGDMSCFLPAGPDGEMHALHCLDTITIDGDTGRVWIGEVPLIDGDTSPHVWSMLVKATDLRHRSVASGIVIPDLEGPQRIMLCHNWGDTLHLEMTLDYIAEMSPEMRAAVTLDLRPPAEFQHIEDEALRSSFTVSSPSIIHDKFITEACNQLHIRAKALAGLSIVMPKGYPPSATWTKYRVAKQAESMADFLSSQSAIMLSEYAVDTIFGTHEAMEITLAALQAAGHSVQVLQEPEPPEYSALSLMMP